MDVSGVILRQISLGVDSHSYPSVFKPSFLGDSIDAGLRFSGELGHLGRRNLGACLKPRSSFCDEGHLRYYSPAIRCGGGSKEKEKCNKEKKMKKRLKLLKGLGKDIALFEDMGFGLDPPHALAHQVKGKMISEAADVLLGQLQQLKAEKKEMKKQRKEEKARHKAARMQNKLECKGSSSSSSESSDSECGEVVDMSRLKAESRSLQNESEPAITHAPPPQAVVDEERGLEVCNSSQTSVEICSSSSGSCTTVNKVDNLGFNEVKGAVTGESTRKIEVCMGGKCKKSGAALLLDEFQKAVGGEGDVVGCKCMGKCRSAPNVKVLNSIDGLREEVENDSVRTPVNPLCVGVGLEDVETIVANFFGGIHKDLKFAAAS